jgi:hypothetical protein
MGERGNRVVAARTGRMDSGVSPWPLQRFRRLRSISLHADVNGGGLMGIVDGADA